MKTIIKKALITEKSYSKQDQGVYSFLVNQDANKAEIKQAIQTMFGVKVENVNTSSIRKKTRRLGRSRVHTKRAAGKVAHITLQDRAKIDLTKLKK